MAIYQANVILEFEADDLADACDTVSACLTDNLEGKGAINAWQYAKAPTGLYSLPCQVMVPHSLVYDQACYPTEQTERSKVRPARDAEALARYAAMHTDLDDACRIVQDGIGQSDGGVASQHFAHTLDGYTNSRYQVRLEMMRSYYNAEMEAHGLPTMWRGGQ